jgi:hypothetical protein
MTAGLDNNSPPPGQWVIVTAWLTGQHWHAYADTLSQRTTTAVSYMAAGR